MIRKQKKNRKGFTLIEVIIVLVILALLVSFMVPIFTGYIQKARIRTCQVSMVQVKRAYLAEAAYTAYQVKDEKALLSNAVEEYGGSVKTSNSYDADCGGVVTVVYASDKSYIKDLICSIHGSLSGAITGLVVTTPAPDSYFTAETIRKLSFKNYIDSTSTNGKNVAKVLAYFAEQNIDLSSMGIQSWAVRRDNTGSPIREVIWSDQDIATMNEGSEVRTIVYHVSDGTYTAGYAKVEKKNFEGDNYMVFSDLSINENWQSYYGQDDATRHSYETTVNIFNQMPVTQ